MSSTDIFLKFSDRTAMETAFATVGWHTTDPVSGDPVFPPVAVHGAAAVDIIGAIRTPPVLDAEDNVIEPAATTPGWHVNVRLRTGGVLPAELEAFVLDPAPVTPHRRFL